jgi:fatty-acid desaturase
METVMKENKTQNVSTVTKHTPSIFAIVVEKILLSIICIGSIALVVSVILFPEYGIMIFIAFLFIYIPVKIWIM